MIIFSQHNVGAVLNLQGCKKTWNRKYIKRVLENAYII